MAQKLGYVALVVRDYDEALAFFTNALGFEIIEDTPLGGGKRWVLVAPPSSAARACFSLKLPPRNKPAALAIRPEAAFFSFSTPTTSGATTAE